MANKKAVLETAIEDLKDARSSGLLCDMLLERVGEWYKAQGIKRLKRGLFLRSDGSSYKLDSMIRDFTMNHVHLIGNKTPVNKLLLIDALYKFIEDMDRAEQESLRLSVTYDKSIGDDDLINWLKGTLGTNNIDTTQLKVMKHWLWQVKRKLFGLPVSNHMMVVFSGVQGSGKSTSIKSLLKPVSQVSIEMKADQLTDDRNYAALNDNFVMFLDEMHDAKRKAIEEVKHIITADYITYRPMRTNEATTVRQNCSFVACVNHSLADVLADSTGMRRFWEFSVDPGYLTARRDWWGLVNRANVLNIWKSINENSNEIIIDSCLEVVEAEQSKLKAVTSVEEWVSETDLSPCGSGEGSKKNATELYLAYLEHCKKYGRTHTYTQTRWGREMRKLGFIKHVEGGKKVFYWYIDDPKVAALRSAIKSKQINVIQGGMQDESS